MRLCFIGWADVIHLERWAGYFARTGCDVSVISFSEVGHYPTGVRQYRLGLAKRGMRWKEVKMRYLLWRINPDVVHVHWAGFAHPVARSWSGPLVVTAYGSDIYRLGEQPDAVAKECAVGLNAADVITCDSEDLRQRIREFRADDQKPVYLVQWGVDTSAFFPAPPDPDLMSELNLTTQAVVLSPRHIFPLYNQKTIVSAFASVVKEVPDAVLVLKHHDKDDDYFRSVERQVANLGLEESVRFVGTVPYQRMAALYSIAAVTVSVPLSDATPMSILEAMACGSVPVVSDLPSLREWIQDGWNGHLVSPHDSDVLAQRIVDLLKSSNVRNTYSRRNLQVIKDKASHDVHMNRMAAIYHSLIESPQPWPRSKLRSISGGKF